VAVNASGRQSRREAEDGHPVAVPGIFDAMAMTMDTMQNAIARLKLAAYSPDIVIEIPRDLCTFYEFYRAGELIDFGRRQASATFAA
jgi:NTE family protein